MTQPMPYGGRPRMPAPGAPTPELRLARFRPHARRLLWPALVVIAVAGAVGYYYENLPAPFQDWMLLTAAGIIVLLLAIVPFARWWGHTFTITTRRVIEQSGVFGTRRTELSHVRGYSIQLRRGPLQRLWGAGTLILTNGVDPAMRLQNIPTAQLVHEALVDQVEVNQILAHRDAQQPMTGPTGAVG